MDLLLVRHGESEGNRRGFVQGWQDTVLTPLGQRQAAQVAQRIVEYLPLDAIYASPLKRAWRTAEVIASVAQMTVIADTNLREMHFGEVEGMTHIEWHKRYPQLLPRWADRDDLDFGWPGGESRRQFAQRVYGAITEIIEAHPQANRVLVVCHGGVISTYLSVLLQGSATMWRDYQVNNCTISQVRFGDGKPQLLRFNDGEHLIPETEDADAEAE